MTNDENKRVYARYIELLNAQDFGGYWKPTLDSKGARCPVFRAAVALLRF